MAMLDFLLPGQGATPFDITQMSPWLRPTAAPEWATIMPQPGGFGSLAGGPVEPLPAPIDVARPPGMLPPGAVDDNAVLPSNATPTSGPPLSLGGPNMATSAAAPAVPQGSLLDRIGQGINDNSGMLMALGAGLAGSSTLGEGLSRGLQLAQAGGAADRKRRNENATAKWLQSQGYSVEDAAAIAGNPTVLQSLLTQRFGKQATADIQEYEYAKKQGFTGSLADWMASKRGGAGEVSLTPQYGVNDQGETVMLQPGRSGVAVQTQLPPGVKLAPNIEKVDLGTEWGFYDRRNGALLKREPKNLAEAAAQTKLGETQGTVRASLPTDLLEAKKTTEGIDQLLAMPGLDETVGSFDQYRPSWTMSDSGKDALARYEQLKGRAFLQAYAMLRGGGAITENEGTKAENAMARMQRYQSEGEFKAALRDFRDAVTEGARKLREKAGLAGDAVASPPPGSPTAGAGPASAPAAAPGLPPPPSGFNLVR